MTFHGHGFLLLELSHVLPLGGDVYSGFGFRSTQDSGLLYRRSSPVCRPALHLGAPLPVSDLCPALPSLTSCLLAHLLQ